VEALYIALSIPVFFLMIGVELWVNTRRGNPAYRFADSITNLSCGVGSVVVGIFTKGMELAVFTALWTHYRLFDLSASGAAVWLLALFGVDLCYYAFHRASHRVNAFWAGHVAHHQSEEYNLSVALRQSWVVPLFAWAFYAPLLVLGVPPVVVLGMRTLNTLYQFWIHTEVVGRLGPLEWVLNTPSHHRVHHGVNPRYIDKNYAGIFIIWDRLLGTFEPEGEEVVYGLVKPLRSWNPLWANVHRFVEMGRVSLRARRWRDKLWIWLAGPEWLPADLGGVQRPPPQSRAAQHKYDTAGAPRGLVMYVGVSFAVVAVAVTALLYVENDLAPAELALLCAFICVGLVAWGGLLQGQGWGAWVEALRWVGTAGALAALLPGRPQALPVLLGSAAVAAAFALWALRYRRVDGMVTA
jgi:sterol desaturase/sphingolipid hydroxylase (fatty acid hydroxylase superfamily)